MRKMIYLGGMYQAEASMLRSFQDHGAEIVFLMDNNAFGNNFMSGMYGNFNKSLYPIQVVPDANLASFLASYKPDCVVHRFYESDPSMHVNAVNTCKAMGIPYVYFRMENSATDVPGSANNSYVVLSDLFVYTHQMNSKTLAYLNSVGRKHYFYPYGVSSFERAVPTNKPKDVGSFGYFRDVPTRTESIERFLVGLGKIGCKMNVYGIPGNPCPWTCYPGPHSSSLILNPGYPFETAPEIMCQHKVALNISTMDFVEGAWSHKMFQSMGCGVATVTWWKQTIENSFGPCGENLVTVKNVDELAFWVDKLLKDAPYREAMALRGYNHVHTNFDWYLRFEHIMKDSGVWK